MNPENKPLIEPKQISRRNFIQTGAKGIAFFTAGGIFLNILEKDMPQKENYLTQFHSEKGKYSLPIKHSAEYVIIGLGSDKQPAVDKFVRRHSAENIWTYNITPTTMLSPELIRMDFGVDQFLRIYNPSGPNPKRARISVGWYKTENSLEDDLTIRKEVIAESNGTWEKSSDKIIKIDGLKCLLGKYITPYLKNANSKDIVFEYSTNLLLHKFNRVYNFAFSYTGNYTDPDNTIDTVLMKMKFD